MQHMPEQATGGERAPMAVAYHEAGHAVAAYLCGRAVHRLDMRFPDQCRIMLEGVSTMMPATIPGHRGSRARRSASVTSCVGDHREIWNDVLIRLAGPAAEAIQTGAYGESGGRDDITCAVRLAQCGTDVHAEDDVALAEWLLASSRRFLLNRDIWPLVETVAGALLEEQVIQAERLRRILARVR